MPISFDATGFRHIGSGTWQAEATGDLVSLHYFDKIPDLPASLDDPAELRRGLAIAASSAGCLIHAEVVSIDSIPAVYQLLKVPLPDRPSGQAFMASFILPRAESSAVLKLQAPEGSTTGVREALVMAQVGVANYFRAHPYAPDLKGRLPSHVGDDPEWDERFPDHPLTRARHWAHRVMASARVDPRFAALPPYQSSQPEHIGQPEPTGQAQAAPPSSPAAPGDQLVTVLPGLPVGDVLPLWGDDGSVAYWQVGDPDGVRARLGVGGLARSEVDTRRYRDALLFNPSNNTLFFMNRYRDNGAADGTTVPVTPLTEAQALAAITQQALSDLCDWLGQVVASAAQRREFVAVETGGWDVPMHPYVLVLLRPGDGGWQVVIETEPVPLGAPVWRDQQPVDGAGQTLVSPADDKAIQVAGHLIGFAFSTWSVPVLRLGLSFGPNPTFAGS